MKCPLPLLNSTIKVVDSFTFRLFRCKIFSKKCFRHFSMFGGGENNGQRKLFSV
jgi:hypothetical protein